VEHSSRRDVRGGELQDPIANVLQDVDANLLFLRGSKPVDHLCWSLDLTDSNHAQTDSTWISLARAGVNHPTKNLVRNVHPASNCHCASFHYVAGRFAAYRPLQDAGTAQDAKITELVKMGLHGVQCHD
jgi:hypothetical protein